MYIREKTARQRRFVQESEKRLNPPKFSIVTHYVAISLKYTIIRKRVIRRVVAPVFRLKV